MKLTAIIAGVCVLAFGLGMLLPSPNGQQAQASAQVPTLVAGQR